MLGMGTLTKPDQAASAKAAGANFLVSPICEPALVKAMVASGLLTMAGALTPTEVFQAYSLGTDVVKVFPGSLGGPCLYQSAERSLPLYPDDAHRRGERRQRCRLVCGRGGGGGCRQRALPARAWPKKANSTRSPRKPLTLWQSLKSSR